MAYSKNDKVLKEAASRLKSLGIRPLSHRVAVYGHLMHVNNHPSVEEIYSELKQSIPTLSKTTVYNVLDHLCEHHAVRKIVIEGREARYDAMTHDHIHFKCNTCNLIYDIEQPKVPQLNLPAGYEVTTTQVYIEGLCPHCAKQMH